MKENWLCLMAFDDLWAETFFEFLPVAIDLAIQPALISK
jgi:hypothetical protein